MTVFFFSLLLLNAAKLQSFGNTIAQFWDFITSHILWYNIIYIIMNVHVWFTASRLDPGLEISSSEQYWAQLDPEGPDTLRPTPGYSPIRLDKPTCVSWCNCAPTHTTHNNYHSTETKRSNTNKTVTCAAPYWSWPRRRWHLFSILPSAGVSRIWLHLCWHHITRAMCLPVKLYKQSAE